MKLVNCDVTHYGTSVKKVAASQPIRRKEEVPESHSIESGVKNTCSGAELTYVLTFR